ncbi:MAG: protein ImuB [Solirubrobacterales bacterium]|jgi:protein ImuB|nr:protein ImuB [Solirubrobacterales bacterium]
MEVACVLIPELALADPVEAGELTERLLCRLERIGAAVESERAGEAFFVLDGLRGIHGGESAGVLAAARRAAEMEVRIGVGTTRLSAHAAAQREAIVPSSAAGDFLAALPVSTLAGRLELSPREAGSLIETMRRLGIERLGALAALPADRVADRFGPAGLRALRLARGEDSLLRPRRPHEELAEEVELPEGAAGGQLEHALKLLVARLLAAPQRKGRTVLGLRLGAVLCGGGSWSVDQGLGRPAASARTLLAVLAPRLETLPGPVAALRLRALGLGPPVGDQLELSVRGEEHRRRRLGEAIREVRAAQGTDSLLRVLPLDSASRFPERWAILTPSPDR